MASCSAAVVPVTMLELILYRKDAAIAVLRHPPPQPTRSHRIGLVFYLLLDHLESTGILILDEWVPVLWHADIIRFVLWHIAWLRVTCLGVEDWLLVLKVATTHLKPNVVIVFPPINLGVDHSSVLELDCIEHNLVQVFLRQGFVHNRLVLSQAVGLHRLLGLFVLGTRLHVPIQGAVQLGFQRVVERPQERENVVVSLIDGSRAKILHSLENLSAYKTQ